MTTSIPISAALLRNITDRKWNNGSAVPAFETGTMTQGPSKGPVNAFERHVKRMVLKSSRQWQRTPERAAMVRQRRGLGSCSRMPYDMRHQYTEGERAALFAVADGLLRALWQGHEEFSELPPYAASRLMHLSAKRYEASRWPRERTAIIAPTAEPASTWWKILKSGMPIPAQKRLQQVLATEIQSNV